MTEVKNPRITEAMTVKSAVACMKLLNKHDLKSLNMEFITGEVKKMQEQCQIYLEKYDV